VEPHLGVTPEGQDATQRGLDDAAAVLFDRAAGNAIGRSGRFFKHVHLSQNLCGPQPFLVKPVNNVLDIRTASNIKKTGEGLTLIK
jgi:hypothetical protein